MQAATMRLIRRWHLYLGVAVTPMLLMFGVSGLAQVWHLHRSSKDGSYQAPAWLTTLSSAHMNGSAVKGEPADVAYQWLLSLAAITLVTTLVLGAVMAWRVAGPRTVGLLLAAGVAIPTALFLLR